MEFWPFTTTQIITTLPESIPLRFRKILSRFPTLKRIVKDTDYSKVTQEQYFAILVYILYEVYMKEQSTQQFSILSVKHNNFPPAKFPKGWPMFLTILSDAENGQQHALNDEQKKHYKHNSILSNVILGHIQKIDEIHEIGSSRTKKGIWTTWLSLKSPRVTPNPVMTKDDRKRLEAILRFFSLGSSRRRLDFFFRRDVEISYENGVILLLSILDAIQTNPAVNPMRQQKRQEYRPTQRTRSSRQHPRQPQQQQQPAQRQQKQQQQRQQRQQQQRRQQQRQSLQVYMDDQSNDLLDIS